MASLQGCKIHDMSGYYRLVVPPSWRKRFNGVSKQRLNVIVSNALVVLPPRELSESELEELVRDIKQYVKVANLMKST